MTFTRSSNKLTVDAWTLNIRDILSTGQVCAVQKINGEVFHNFYVIATSAPIAGPEEQRVNMYPCFMYNKGQCKWWMGAAAQSKYNHKRGVLRMVLDLQQTPETKIYYTRGKREVTNRLEVEEGRSMDCKILLELYLLRGLVHQKWFDTFDLNLQRCLRY